MTLADINNMLLSTGMPVAYLAFNEEIKPTLPAIVYYCTDTDSFSADNISYYDITSITIELYLVYKDTQTEKIVEEALKNHDLYYSKNEDYLKDDKCYMITYEIEV